MSQWIADLADNLYDSDDDELLGIFPEEKRKAKKLELFKKDISEKASLFVPIIANVMGMIITTRFLWSKFPTVKN
ncbi:hypothetical protein ABK040_014469 [Willaertia magna]